MRYASAAAVSALTSTVLSCSTGGLGDLAGALPGMAGGASGPDASLESTADRLELVAERLDCTPQAVHEVTLIELDQLRRRVIDAELDRDARQAVVDDLRLQAEAERGQAEAERARADDAEAKLAEIIAAAMQAAGL